MAAMWWIGDGRISDPVVVESEMARRLVERPVDDPVFDLPVRLPEHPRTAHARILPYGVIRSGPNFSTGWSCRLARR